MRKYLQKAYVINENSNMPFDLTILLKKEMRVEG